MNPAAPVMMIIPLFLKPARKYALALAFPLWAVLAACSSKPTQDPDQASGTRLTVFPLTPALTELAFALCDSNQIPAVGKGSNYPAAALRKPVVSVLPLDLEALARLRPGLVLAEEGMHTEATLRAVRQMGLNVRVLRLQSLEDLWAACDSIGRWTDRRSVSSTIKARTQAAILPYRNRLADRRIRMAVLFYFSPIMGYGPGNWMDAKLRYLGVRNALAGRASFVTLPAEELDALPATHIALPRNEGSIPDAFLPIIARRPQVRWIRLDEDLETRPSLRLVEQLQDICAAVDEGARP